jgi:hypothetical protein
MEDLQIKCIKLIILEAEFNKKNNDPIQGGSRLNGSNNGTL